MITSTAYHSDYTFAFSPKLLESALISEQISRILDSVEVRNASLTRDRAPRGTDCKERQVQGALFSE
jgi:hypothetical protein